MPRVANNTDALMKDLISRLERLVETARQEGRDEALADIRNLVDGGAKGPRGRKPAAADTAKKPRKKSKKPRKNPWATMTAAQKKERVRKMLAGRGLKPKDER